MPDPGNIQISGRITDVFAHRFVIETTDGIRKLADLGPKGSEAFKLTIGAEIVAHASAKPSELKIHRIALKNGNAIAIEHDKGRDGHKHADHEDAASQADATNAVKSAGLEPLGEPRRKPKHFEVLARKGKAFVECHVAFDGIIRKEKVIDDSDGKWADALKSAAKP